MLIHKSDGTPYSAEEGCVWLGMLSSVVYKHLTVPCSSSNSQELPCSWTCLVAQMVKNLPAMQDTWVQSLAQEDALEKGMATHSNILREGNGNPLRYSYLKRSMDRGAWWATVHGVVKSQIQLRDFHSLTFDIV